jgi:hypothetical protein
VYILNGNDMGENKLKPSEMDLVLSVKKCIEIASGIKEQCEDAAKRLRSMQSKRANKSSVEFWSAVVYHLKRLEDE